MGGEGGGYKRGENSSRRSFVKLDCGLLYILASYNMLHKVIDTIHVSVLFRQGFSCYLYHWYRSTVLCPVLGGYPSSRAIY